MVMIIVGAELTKDHQKECDTAPNKKNVAEALNKFNQTSVGMCM